MEVATRSIPRTVKTEGSVGKDAIAALIALGDNLLEENGGEETQPKTQTQSKKEPSPALSVQKLSKKESSLEEAVEAAQSEEESSDSQELSDHDPETNNAPAKETVDAEDPQGLKRKRRDDEEWKPGTDPAKLKKLKKTAAVPKKKQPRVVKNPVDKLSFQEAAVRVLAEQREKGIHALSTRRIWELIQQTGLVDTKCRTPVSSLSSRITEDVRTKGNKSVFIRVGEGLYALRKGMKKQDLEKFLNTTLPDLALTPDSKLEEMEEEPAEEEDEEEEAEDAFESADAPNWCGLPIRTKSNGKMYYGAVSVGKHVFRIGDCAFFSSKKEGEKPFVGRIIKLWQQTGAKGSTITENMKVKSVWYYYPENLPADKAKKASKNELFLSELTDVNIVDTLLSPVEVLPVFDFNNRMAHSKTESKDIFFCKQFFSKGKLSQIRIDVNGHVKIDGENRSPSVANWPTSLTYTNSLLWKNVSPQMKDQLRERCASQSAEVEIRTVDGDQVSVYACVDLQPGTILGEFTGNVIQKNSRTATDPENANFIRTLYEKEELKLVVDAREAGNEFRFVKFAQNGWTPNVRFVSYSRKPVKTQSLFCVVIAPINKGDELFAASPLAS